MRITHALAWPLERGHVGLMLVGGDTALVMKMTIATAVRIADQLRDVVDAG